MFISFTSVYPKNYKVNEFYFFIYNKIKKCKFIFLYNII